MTRLPSPFSVAAVAYLGLGVFAAPAGAQFFFPPVSHAVPNPRGLVVANLIGDANIDIATTDLSGAAITVLRGVGGGSFAAPITLPVGTSPMFLASGDVNRDGRLDLITANWDSGTVSVVLRRSSGYQPARHFVVGMNPTCVAVGDLNGDSRPDLVTANFNANAAVSVLLGDGLGGFTLPVQTPLAAPADCVVTGDWNGDGRLDVAVTSRYVNAVTVLLGDGAGHLTLRQMVQTPGRNPVNLAVGDLNGDGRQDLAVASYAGAGGVLVLVGTGDGFFSLSSVVNVGVYTFGIAVGDVNRDGRADVVAGDGVQGARNAYVLLGNGLGGLGAPTTLQLSSGPGYIVLADSNRDGVRDIVCNEFWADQVTLMLGF